VFRGSVRPKGEVDLPAKFQAVCRELPVEFTLTSREISVKFEKRRKGTEVKQRPLDKVSSKRPPEGQKARHDWPGATVSGPISTRKPRGRRRKIQRSWVTGRAYNYWIQLSQVWQNLEGPLLAAKTTAEVTAAFENHAKQYAQGFVPGMTSDILALIRDRKFPKRPQPRINFLADSLGGRPNLSLRTSRDICERERARQLRKSRYHIIRHEFYIECSCGYKGPARDNACKKCGAPIQIKLDTIWGNPGPFWLSPARIRNVRT